MGVEVIRETQADVPDALAMVRRYLEGDSTAGEGIALIVRTILGRRMRRLAVENSTTEELIQDCMLQVFARLPEYSIDKGQFESWVGGFAVNALRSHRRKESRSRLAGLSVDDLPEVGYDIAKAEHDRELLSAALETLDVLDRELLHMRFSLGMSSEEIAACSDFNGPQVRKRISRAVEQLRRHPSIGSLLP